MVLVVFSLFGCNYPDLTTGEDKAIATGSEINDEDTVRIGYFHGGRTHILYRSYVNSEFENEAVDVTFLTKYARKDELYPVPKKHEEVIKIFEEEKTIFRNKVISINNKSGNIEYPEFYKFGSVTGPEIVDSMLKGNLDGGTIGEASFIYHISKNSPIIAVAMLGYEEKDRPGKAFVLRKGIVINNSDDFKGKTLAYRRAGPLDKILLLEFLKSEGVKEEDVVIRADIWVDEQKTLMQEGKIDGGMFHLHPAKNLVTLDAGYIYRKMDWIDFEISHGLLVFNKDFYDENKEEIKKIIRTYIKRIHYEHNLTEEERKEPTEFGLQMELDFKGMNLPQYKDKPFVRIDLLEQMQDLELEYGVIQNKTDISSFVDQEIVSEVLEELGYT